MLFDKKQQIMFILTFKLLVEFSSQGAEGK
jgi:hypothetical protein